MKKIKPAHINLSVDAKGKMNINVKGKQIDLVKLMTLCLLESENLRELVGDSMFIIMETHLEAHGLDLKDIMHQAIHQHRSNPFDMKNMTRPKKRVVN